ncbi:hypothetical protein ACFE04_010942 [Oxalis oulophora]
MAESSKIIRKSIYTFLQNYHYFTTTAALLAFPFSASILLSHVYAPILPTIFIRIRTLFQAAGFPPSYGLFNILSLKISQTISTSFLTLPFTLSFFLLAKSCIIRFLNYPKHTSVPSVFFILRPLFATFISNSFLIISANATAFSILFFAFTFLEGSGFSSRNFFFLPLSAAGAILYSIVLANVLILCNLALVLSGIENSGGYLSILKAFVLIRGRASTALTLAVPVSLSLAAIEALFQFRIVRAYNVSEKINYSMAVEGIFIAYLYSIFVVIDTVVSCIFYKSCCRKVSCGNHELRYAYRIEIAKGEIEHSKVMMES